MSAVPPFTDWASMLAPASSNIATELSYEESITVYSEAEELIDKRVAQRVAQITDWETSHLAFSSPHPI